MEWFGIGFALLFPALLIVLTALLIRIAFSNRRTNQLLEQTNQKLERVVAELRMARLHQLGEAPAEPSAVAPGITAPAKASADVPQITAPAEPSAAAPMTKAPAETSAVAPKTEVFAPDIKCYYCGGNRPLTRYLGQPICAACQKNALLKDDPAKR